MQQRPFQKPPPKPPPSEVRALRSVRSGPVPTRASLLHLSKCGDCIHRPESTIPIARLKLAKTKEAVGALDSLVRRVTYQLDTPGGRNDAAHALPALVEVDVDARPAALPLEAQAVSPRFLRRLCKLYTSSDLIVDHSVAVMHYRPDVDRSVYLGEMYAADRFRCALRLFVFDTGTLSEGAQSFAA